MKKGFPLVHLNPEGGHLKADSIVVKRITTFVLSLVGALAASTHSSWSAQPIQEGIGNVTPLDNTALAGSVGVRIFSIGQCESGSDVSCIWGSYRGINLNYGYVHPECLNQRCLRSYATLGGFATPGGYAGNVEFTSAYNSDVDKQTFYAIWDGQVNAGAGNHAAFYAAQGTVASSIYLPLGDFRKSGCVGTLAANCFPRADSTNSDQTPLTNVNAGYQGPHTLASIGGLSPVPTVRVAASGSGVCGPDSVWLTWDDPELYLSTLNSNVPDLAHPPSAVKGVRLYVINVPCSTNGGLGPGGDLSAGWIPIAAFGVSAGTTGTCVPITGDTWFALTIRFRGPSLDPSSEIESGIVGGTGFVGANSQCAASPFSPTVARIVNLTAGYAGRGIVKVGWTSGSEGRVQGFYLTRGSSWDGPFERVSPLVDPRGDGQTYEVRAKTHAFLGRVQYYSIEVVNADGTSDPSGPIAVTLPAAKQTFARSAP